MANAEYIEERLKAYILPRTAETPAEIAAMELAIQAQVDYETAFGEIPAGAQSISNDGVSITFADAASGANTDSNISPAAKAILQNAGLIRRAWPTARKP